MSTHLCIQHVFTDIYPYISCHWIASSSSCMLEKLALPILADWMRGLSLSHLSGSCPTSKDEPLLSFSQYFINLFARDSSLPPHKVISFMGPIQYTSFLVHVIHQLHRLQNKYHEELQEKQVCDGRHEVWELMNYAIAEVIRADRAFHIALALHHGQKAAQTQGATHND